MDGWARVGGGDAHGGVLLGGGRATDQERQREAAACHLLSDVHHLVQRGCDQTGQADGVGAELDRGVEDLVRGHHNAQVVDLVVVAAQHHSDDVLADIVDVALHRGGHQLAAHAHAAGGLLLRLHERLEVRDSALHRARALDHLGQEHLAGAEEVAHDFHPVHQWALDNQQALSQLHARFLGVGLDELHLTMEDGVCQPLLDGAFAPGQVNLALGATAGHVLGEVDQTLRRVGSAVEDDVLDEIEQVLGDVLVHNQLARVDDAHVQARANRVIEKCRVDRLADPVVAAERERKVGDAARNPHAGETLLDLSGCVDVCLRVARVLLDPGRDRQDVGVEDDVLGAEAGLLGEELVSSAADRHLALECVGLAGLVERHHHDGGPVLAHQASLLEEGFLAALEADRVAHTFALEALQAGLEDGPLGAVDHDRDAGDLGLGRDEVQKTGHRLL